MNKTLVGLGAGLAFTLGSVVPAAADVPPNTSITTPFRNSTVTNIGRVTGTASDSDGQVTRVEVVLEGPGGMVLSGNADIRQVTSQRWTWELGLSGALPEGGWRISATAFDNASPSQADPTPFRIYLHVAR